jgi:Na+-translocating ferredoxin:NAD+ oxidoreductase RnfD subunit
MHVAMVLLTLQVLGQTVLDFRLSVAQILACLVTGALIEFVVVFFKDHSIMWPASGLLTGNSTAFILRVPGTLHGQWWSTHGIEIFVGVVAISMASKYLIRWRGRHIFNPSNLGLVLAFVALGPTRTEPLDLWWIPMGPWMIVTYIILIGGGLLIGWRIGLLGMEVSFMACFAAFVAFGMAYEPDHCMVASWHLSPLCGMSLWQILVTSPEILIFALFMIPDPRTVPDGKVSRVVFGAVVALIAVLLLGPTTLEFWTKTAILASLVVACALRFALVRFLAPFEAEREGLRWMFDRFRWRVPAGIAVALVCVGCLPISSDLSTHGPQPVAGLSDGSTPAIALNVGSGPDIGDWVTTTASAALPPPSDAQPVSGSASARLWVLPAIPPVTVSASVRNFDPGTTQKVATSIGHDAVFDLIIEAEARRNHDANLASSGAVADGLKVFTDYMKQDVAAGRFVTSTYTFSSASISLFLPKFATQASRLEGLTLIGSVTLVTRDRSGNVISQTTAPYNRSWSVQGVSPACESDLPPPGECERRLIDTDYTGLALAG